MTDPDLTSICQHPLFHKPDWVAAIIRDCAARHRVSIADIMRKPCRLKRVVRARNEAIYRVKAAKPHLSAGKIGVWFDREHTTILYSIAKYQATHPAAPELTNFSRFRRAA